MREIVSGRKPVLEALRSERGVEKLYIKKGELTGSIHAVFALAKEKRVPVQYCDQRRLDELAEGGLHQGVAALLATVAYKDVADLLRIAKERNEAPFLLTLDGILDPHNYGAMLRTAEVCGCHGVIVPRRNMAPMTQVVHKASAGATHHIAIAQVTNLTDTVKRLKEKNIWVYGADLDGANYTDTDLTGAVALVIGSEGEGIGHGLKKHLDGILTLPVRGRVDSLNASNACAVLLYEVLRQNRAKK